MSIVNTREKTLQTKVVYYGPGLGGKTTSLQVVHKIIDPEGQGKLVSLKTDQDRTLFFDFLPLDLGDLGGYRIKIQAFTVPGQVKYNLTRRYVLMGADAVVFVADSQDHRLDENRESMLNLAENLQANGLQPDTPLVIQLNKRDLPNILPAKDMIEALGKPDAPVFESSATQSEGVYEPFVESVRLMLARVARQYDLGASADEASERVASYLSSLTA